MLPIQTRFPECFFQEETKCDYKITTPTKHLWAVLLDLMMEFDRVCKKHGIRYAIDSGTLLGAVRHKGFIPWDDDVDVIMLRTEYEKLCQIAPKAFKHPYFWQNNETDPGSARRHGQLRNSATTAILKEEMKDGHPLYTFNQGIFIDVFILDEVPDREEDLNSLRDNLTTHIAVLWELRQMLYTNNCLPWIQDALNREAHLFDNIVSQYNGKGSKRIANLSLNPQRKESTLFDATLFANLTEYTFEGFTFPGPKNYDTVLTGYYGNWHEFVKGDNAHGGLLVDTEKPYTDYFKKQAQVPEKNHDSMHVLAELVYQRNMAWEETEKTKQNLYRAWRDYESTRKELDAANEDLDTTRKALEAVSMENQKILNSQIWRMTNFLRRLKKKATPFSEG